MGQRNFYLYTHTCTHAHTHTHAHTYSFLSKWIILYVFKGLTKTNILLVGREYVMLIELFCKGIVWIWACSLAHTVCWMSQDCKIRCCLIYASFRFCHFSVFSITLRSWYYKMHTFIAMNLYCFSFVRCLLSRDFVRIGKWFVQPYDGSEKLIGKR